jgi:predicted DNA-binding antitoxin AbrB/MazE fold protein
LSATITAVYEKGIFKPLEDVSLLQEHQQVEITINPFNPRVVGLHSGAIWTSDDFNEPLPEKFWMENV